MKLFSQFEQVDNATPLARRDEGNISEGIAHLISDVSRTISRSNNYPLTEQGPMRHQNSACRRAESQR